VKISIFKIINQDKIEYCQKINRYTKRRGTRMKAVIYSEYGLPEEVLRLEEVEKPIPGDDEVLLKVKAASINYSNAAFVTGKPFIIRLMGGGLFKPTIPILGSDVAGQVEAVGKNTKQFQPGDEVYGDLSDCGRGGFAEYVAVPEKAIALKPANLTFEETAAVPEAAVVALQGLRDDGRIQAGQKVLIYGASGGIGTFAVQIANSYGAEVTGVCSTRNLEMVRSIGADHVIDYTQEDFTQNGQQYDLILATAGYRSLFDYARALTPEGIYVATGGSLKQVFQPMYLAPIIAMQGKKKMGNLLVRIIQEDLIYMKELIEAGKVTPVIDRVYPLGEIAEAIRYYREGHSRGKVVITVES
jgi:NADPH:quinone reductase-like Zn-dependent oxidoreductase